ncbi:MAG: OmpA family protein, partial [bacterium]
KNFVLIIDQSGSMHTTYHGKSKHLLARETARRFFKHVPRDINVKGAIYMYGIMAAAEENQYIRVQNFIKYNRQSFLKEFDDEVQSQTGPGALDSAIKQLREDTGEIDGHLAVVIISGGITRDYDASYARDELRALRHAYNDVCAYTILVGKSKRGGKNLEKVQKASHCGKRTSIDVVDNDKGMEKFVNRIFYKNVDEPADSDDDGVPDSKDQCSNTPYGANVDSRGCWVLNDINFDVDKAKIKPGYYNRLDKIASIMNANPGLHIMVEGHTDSTGDEAYNQKLSNERANAVKDYLTNQGDVDPERLTAVGKGEAEPVASNDTSSGRSQNRRIEFQVLKK